MNRALELHDSRLRSTNVDASGVHLQLIGYVHQSDGRPGIDAGTGWLQGVELSVWGPGPDVMRIHSSSITDGELRIDDNRYAGLVPLPLEQTGSVRLQLRLEGWTLSLAGHRISVRTVGEAEFVETFPGE